MPPPTDAFITNDSDAFARKTCLAMQLAAVVIETTVRPTDPPPLAVLVLAVTLVRAPANSPTGGGGVRVTNATGRTAHV